jgi:hypothetical protein
MISRNNRINAFTELGKYLTNPQNSPKLEELAINANRKNNWFTVPNVLKSLSAIATQYLDADKLSKWADSYDPIAGPRKVGVIMAGNIPAVGFHDALAVLISGHQLMAKLSSEDQVILPALLEILKEIEPAFNDQIEYAERLNAADAYIGTGSDNTARYFHYYFAKKPNIIRRNRTSVAVLTGAESAQELENLGSDVIQYFGLGCRNVSKVFVPEGYDFTKFYESIQSFDQLCLYHHKYFNNYEYNKSVLLINRTPHFDNGFLMITENEALVSPISVVYYQTYKNMEDVQEQLTVNGDKIQCIISNNKNIAGSIPFGQSQSPGLFDYADSVDSMKFLSEI